MKNPQLWAKCGIAGVLGVVCYLIAVFASLPDTQLGTAASLVLISLWPILSIIYSYGLRDYIAAENDTAANRLAFVFAVTAFTTVLAMIIVQLAVKSGVGEITVGLEAQLATAIRRGLRMIDQGLDVAWDILIAVALILAGVAMRRRRGLGYGWGVPSIVAGIALVALNFATFPWPPNTRGLFDIGPFIALYMTLLAARLAQLGLQARRVA